MLQTPQNITDSSHALFDSLADALMEQGWFVLPGFLSPSLVNAINEDIHYYQQNGSFIRAGIGRGDDFQIDLTVRRDKTLWLTRESVAQGQFLTLMESLRLAMNQRLFLGLFEYESHFSLYDPGAFYATHKDSFRGASNRILSTVAYLNSGWAFDNGGLLRIFDEHNDTLLAEILPEAGTLVVFLSEVIPHEVTRTERVRRSIAGWFRCNNNLDGVIDPGR